MKHWILNTLIVYLTRAVRLTGEYRLKNQRDATGKLSKLPLYSSTPKYPKLHAIFERWFETLLARQMDHRQKLGKKEIVCEVTQGTGDPNW